MDIFTEKKSIRLFLSRLNSLRFKLVILPITVLLGLLFFFSALGIYGLQSSLQTAQMEQSSVNAQLSAFEINKRLQRRMDGLISSAEVFDPQRLNDPAYLRGFLKDRSPFWNDFTGGVFILDKSGTAVADYPPRPGRLGADYSERAYLIEAMATRRAVISKPLKAIATLIPVVAIAAPYFDAQGQAAGVIVGHIDLNAPVFLGLVTQPAQLGVRERFVVSIKDELIVTASDKSRVLQPVARLGKSQVMDHMRAGNLESTIAKNAQGIQKVYSFARVPLADWIVLEAMPAAIIFKPLQKLIQILTLGAAAATFAAVMIATWLSRQSLDRLKHASGQLNAMSHGEVPLGQLPEVGDAEVQFLMRSFNRLTDRLMKNSADILRSSEDLRATKERLETAASAGIVGVWSWDIAANVLIWDAVMHQLYGIRPEDFDGSYEAWANTIHPDDREMVGKAMQATLRGECEFSAEIRIVWPDGTVHNIKGASKLTRDANGTPASMIGVNYDCTEQKRTTEELRMLNQDLEIKVAARSEKINVLHQLLEEILESVPFGVAVCDAEHKLTLHNTLFGSLLGYPPELLSRDPLMFADIVRFNVERGDHPDRSFEEVLATFLGMMDGGQSVQMERKLSNGTTLDIRGLPISQGWTLLTYADISEHKRIEQFQRKAQLAAEAANQAKSDFLANMSHEIRTPMNGIVGMSYLLEQLHLPADAAAMVRKIRAAGADLLSIIDDILDFSKIEAGHQIVEGIDFDMFDVLEQLGALMSSYAGNKQIELVISPPPHNTRFLIGDPVRLKQVLLNLTGNAIKFTPSGQVVVEISDMSSVADLVVLHFSVRDTGIGIDIEQQLQVFQPFTQADSTTTRRFGGTGLGLSISQSLVQLMGGEIGLSSVSGEGSDFSFTLSFVRSQTFHSHAPNLQGVHIVVAEPHQLAREALRKSALTLGLSTTLFEDCESAVDHILSHENAFSNEEILLFNWQMPGLNGLDAVFAINQALGDGHGPVIMLLSGYSHSALMADPRSHLVDAVLTKPVTPSSLNAAVALVLRKRHGLVDIHNLVAGKRLQQLRILVVDDSDINRDVAALIFRGEGAQVVTLDDGQQAVDWVKAHPSDLDVILMDVQMPVMGGYEASAKIREIYGLRDFPIVALTAGAFELQREQAIAAGLTDYIAKPFDVDTAIAVILKVTRHRLFLVPASYPPLLQLPPASELADLDIEKGLVIWKEREALVRYLALFATHYTDVLAALETTDISATHTLAHKLKGAAATVGLVRLAGYAGQIEDAIEKQQPYRHLLSPLQESLLRALDASAKLAEELPPAPTAIEVDSVSVNVERLQEPLRQLYAAWDSRDPEVLEAHLAELSGLLAAHWLAPLYGALTEFDFQSGKRMTQVLATRLKISFQEG